MDNITWFKFTPASWIMGKIQRCPEITQARFMRLCCVYWTKKCDVSIEDAEIEIDAEHLNELLRFRVVLKHQQKIKITFLDDQMDGIKNTSSKNSENAKKRWEQNNDTEKKPKAKDPKKEEPEKVKQETIDFDKLLKYINATFGREFKLIDEESRKKYKARLKQGYNSIDIQNAINAVKVTPYHVDSNFRYATPEFFSRSKTLQTYSTKVKPVEGKVQATLNLGRYES